MAQDPARKPSIARLLVALVGLRSAQEDFPPVDLAIDEAVLLQSLAFRITTLWSYEGQATLTNQRFIFQPRRYYVRPSTLDPLLGGRTVSLPLNVVSRTSVSKWKRHFWRTLPGLPILKLVLEDGSKHSFQLFDTNIARWQREIAQSGDAENSLDALQ